MTAADETGWPRPGSGGDRQAQEKAVFDARVAARLAHLAGEDARATETHKDVLAAAAARRAATAAEEQAESDGFRAAAAASRDADLANLQSFAKDLSTLAVGAVERSRAGAEVVQKASAAIVTLYTGLLGFVFVASDNPLPTRGVLAPVFLGLAVVLSTAYLAYVDANRDTTSGPSQVRGAEPKIIARLNATVEAASRIATRRSYLLRASVIALGMGLVYIALPFVTIGTATPAAPGSGPSIAAWPTPSAGGDVELTTVLYEAQVAEVAAAREAATAAAGASAPVDDTWALVVLALVGLAATFGIPKLWSA